MSTPGTRKGPEDGGGSPDRLNAMLTTVPEARPLRHRARLRVLLGAAEIPARLLLWETAVLEPGEAAPVQLHLERPVEARRGEAFTALWHASPDVVGEGVVLEPGAAAFRDRDAEVAARLRALAAGDPVEIVRQALAAAGPRPLPATEVAARAGLSEAEARAALGRLAAEGAARETPVGFVDAAALEALRRHWVDRLAAFHRQSPLRPGMPRKALRARELPAAVFDAFLPVLAADGAFVVEGDAVRLPDFSVQLRPEQEATAAEIVGVYRDAGWQPPWDTAVTRALGPHRATRDLWDHLVATGRLIALGEGLYLHPDRAAEGLAALRALFRDNASVTAGMLRDALAVSRRVVIPFLEWCDARGYTRRAGDARAPGPLLSRPAR